MVDKIISGGQTGADRAALDVAIRLGIGHGGWIAKGRLAEDGTLPETYLLKETGSAENDVRTEKNVISADGTLILSHGPLTGGSAYTEEMAVKHEKPFLHIDASRVAAFEAAGKINAWLSAHQISVLNVAGPRASEDPEIYKTTKDILKTVLYLNLMESSGGHLYQTERPEEEISAFLEFPKTVQQASERLEQAMSFREKAILARMSLPDCLAARPDLISRIRKSFRLPIGNKELLESCRRQSGNPDMRPDEAEGVLLEFFLRRIRESHGLRRIK